MLLLCLWFLAQAIYSQLLQQENNQAVAACEADTVQPGSLAEFFCLFFGGLLTGVAMTVVPRNIRATQ